MSFPSWLCDGLLSHDFDGISPYLSCLRVLQFEDSCVTFANNDGSMNLLDRERAREAADTSDEEPKKVNKETEANI